MSREQGPSPEKLSSNEPSPEESQANDALREYWDELSTKDLKQALNPEDDTMGDMHGMSPAIGEVKYSGDTRPTKSSEEIAKEILEERGEKIDSQE